MNINAPFSVYDVSVFNSLGMERKKISLSGNHLSLDWPDLPAGIYHLRITSDKSSVVKQLAVVK